MNDFLNKESPRYMEFSRLFDAACVQGQLYKLLNNERAQRLDNLFGSMSSYPIETSIDRGTNDLIEVYTTFKDFIDPKIIDLRDTPLYTDCIRHQQSLEKLPRDIIVGFVNHSLPVLFDHCIMELEHYSAWIINKGNAIAIACFARAADFDNHPLFVYEYDMAGDEIYRRIVSDGIEDRCDAIFFQFLSMYIYIGYDR